eukprot:CAMPEP_0202061970 /NCGR_PEP_ID=MMETSP0963-20130614/42645_1 /ASSEMBLY_ACC=CAM_ASM_000494 /TAXON_ID=4773 /ORGANISM="Schizochytrium aggregatum, Strain ATCC28209" /LENGTH=348 /DNA_ID=CAMNT_0048628235 /DNA_START=45 /DNA_END=1091 /DNA_ORIENTATION=+
MADAPAAEGRQAEAAQQQPEAPGSDVAVAAGPSADDKQPPADDEASDGEAADGAAAAGGEAPAAKRARTDGPGGAAIGPVEFFAIGFCGVDDSAPTADLTKFSLSRPWIEWGVLFRPEKVGEPRFPTMAFVKDLCTQCTDVDGQPSVKLAAHLCSSRCEQVLRGDASFVQELHSLGFRRVQVNATAANGVDTSNLAPLAPKLLEAILGVPGMEWILQRNEETKPLWEYVLSNGPPANVSVLFDDSVGTGVQRKTFPCPSTLNGTPCGYAGGLGPANMRETLEAIQASVGPTFADKAKYRSPWVDMESSLRGTKEDGTDYFSMEKVRAVVETVEKAAEDGVIKLPALEV